MHPCDSHAKHNHMNSNSKKIVTAMVTILIDDSPSTMTREEDTRDESWWKPPSLESPTRHSLSIPLATLVMAAIMVDPASSTQMPIMEVPIKAWAASTALTTCNEPIAKEIYLKARKPSILNDY